MRPPAGSLQCVERLSDREPAMKSLKSFGVRALDTASEVFFLSLSLFAFSFATTAVVLCFEVDYESLINAQISWLPGWPGGEADGIRS